jgi:hypothetical protein
MVTPQAVTAVSQAELLAARRWLSTSRSRDVDTDVIAELPPSAVYRALARHYDGGWPQFQRDSTTMQHGLRGRAERVRGPRSRRPDAEERRSR